MKKLMFVAAVSASVAAFGAPADEFDADTGVYSVTLTQKSLDVTYADDEDADPEFEPGVDQYQTGEEEGKKWTSAQAKEAAQKYFDDELAAENNLKSISVKSVKEDGENLGYGYRIKYVAKSDKVAKASAVSASVAGILVKGSAFKCDTTGAYDGALILWRKSKDNLTNNLYRAYSYTDATVAAAPLGNKSAGMITIPLMIGGTEVCVHGAGIGTAGNESVKTVSGQVVTTIEGGEFDPLLAGYGTWKIQKDANSTKLAQKGYSLEHVLAKKGGLEIGEASEAEEDE